MTIECSQSVHSIVSTLHQNTRCEPDGCRIVAQKSQRDFPKSNICVILSKVIRLLQFAGDPPQAENPAKQDSIFMTEIWAVWNRKERIR
ncbi:hypothetical protein DWW59_02365 [Firmicutes bacterium AF16-15]|nr:hypothetical protein DWW59_02365 [Firmicutes bacterium AF16-15]